MDSEPIDVPGYANDGWDTGESGERIRRTELDVRQPARPMLDYRPGGSPVVVRSTGQPLVVTSPYLVCKEFAPFIPSTGANPPGDCRSPTCRPFLLGKVVNPGTLKG